MSQRDEIAKAIEIAIVEKTQHHPAKKYWVMLRWLWPYVADAVIAVQARTDPDAGAMGEKRIDRP